MRYDLDRYSQELAQARAELNLARFKWDPRKHPRNFLGQFRRVFGYHGQTGTDLNEWNPESAKVKNTIWGGSKPLADAYAEGEKVYRVEFEAKNALVINNAAENRLVREQAEQAGYGSGFNGNTNNYDVAEWAQEAGYDAIIVEPTTLEYDAETDEWKAIDGEWGDEEQAEWQELAGTWGEPQFVVLKADEAEVSLEAE